MAKFLIFKRHRFAAFLFYLFCLFLTILIYSCGDGSYDSEYSETASAYFSIEWHDTPASQSSENTRITKALDCEVAGVDTIICEVYDESNTLLTSENWPCSAGSGTIHNIPVGVCVFVILGEDGEGNILYHGETTSNITPGPPTNVGTIDAYSFVPELSAPEDDSTVTLNAFSLDWEIVENAYDYNIMVSDSISFDTPIIDDITNDTSYTPSGLLPSTTYYWKVFARDIHANQGDESEVWSFTTDDIINEIPTASISEPTNGDTFTEGDTVTFSGTGEDVEDGILTGDSLVWSSSIDGQIGTGASFATASLSAGNHTITLTATDLDGATGTDSIIITILTGNTCPVAEAGPDQSVLFGDTVTLDGSGSTDVDEDPLTYSWSLTSVPAGSEATLSDPAAVNPTFDVDVSGTYVAQVIVNDGTCDSAPDTVTISTDNTCPVADAGPDQSVLFGDTITLDGSGSTDVDEDQITYSWSLTSVPAGSEATLSDPAAVNPTFDVDVSGTYVAQLIVNDGTCDSAPDTVTISTDNTCPVADAGPDQSVLFGDTITLDGSGSTDVDEDQITYSWSLTSVPAGSEATLSDPAAVNPTFDVDVSGTYVAQLIVNDGTCDSAPDTVTISTDNTCPVADAGPDQSVLFGDTITLDGSGSTDVDEDQITYSWSLTSVPAGSEATLSDPAAVNPTFDVDVSGTYVAQLIVNDGTCDSAPDTVTISTDNTCPVADAGPDQSVLFGDTITLDGSGSTDVDEDQITYSWSLTSVPAGSEATLSDPAAVNPTFDVDVSGTYVAQLIVNDGTCDSAPDTVTISTDNTCPVAEAGPNQSVLFGDTVTLDGSGSTDVDEDPLNYSWSLTSVPAGSQATLSNPTTVNPTFDVDVSGTYVAQLIVNDGTCDSAPDTVTISTDNTCPVAEAGPNQSVLFGDTVTLDGSGSTDVDEDQITYSWSLTSVPSGSEATLSDPAAVNPTFDVDVSGTYVAQLIVNDGTCNSAPDTVTIFTGNTCPVADAGPNQTVLFGDTVTLDGSGSTDVDLDPITYSWSLTSVPEGSQATLSNPAAVNPTFDVDVSGTYVAQLIVNDGTCNSAPDTVTIFTGNTCPVADAGPNQTVLFGDTVTLDGGGSTDVDQDPLTYSWSLTSVPEGSEAILSNPSAVNPTFYVDVSGTYVAQLIVNDGTCDSAPDTVTIFTGNTCPVADAGPNQTVFLSDTVTLDGSGSYDVDQDPITYSWSLTSVPAGSQATLSNSAAVNPTFDVDVSGTYVAQLIVNDGTCDSAPDTVTISAEDATPPLPNPMTWAIEPYETSTSSISMVATTASDPTGPITYYFDYYSSPTGGSGGNDSVWQSSTTYSDSALGTNHQYGYRVRARDGNDNQTSYSFISYDYTDIETPSGISFGTITNSSIQTQSSNTPSGLTRGSSGLIIYNVTNVTNSGWNQNNNYWTSGSLSTNTQYGFRALARNGDGNTTSYSSTYYRYTLANAPGSSSFSNIGQTSIRANWTANGNPSGTQYYCENQTEGTNSGWITNTYWDSTNLTCSSSYTFRVMARNGDGLVTGWTNLGVQATATCPDGTPPTPNPMTWATVPYETSTSSISMVATTASDQSPPISYYFTYSSLTGGTGGTSSGWQSSTAYTDSGLSVNHQYRYWVQAMDNLGNTTAWSSYSDEYTDIETPSGITFGTVTNSSIQARSTNTPSGLTRGNSGLYINNATNGANSGWKQNNDYWTSGSLSTNTQYGFRALARNGDSNNTSYSSTYYRYTLANMPVYAQFSNVTQTSIRANWTANGNPSWTQYYCENMDNGDNSGWTTNTYWNNTGLDCGASYEYRVMARNGNGLVTSWRYLDNQYTQDCTGFRFDTNNDRWRMVGLYDGGGLDPIGNYFQDVSAPYLSDYGSPSPGSIALGYGGGSFPNSPSGDTWLHWDLNSPDVSGDNQWQDMNSLSYRITGENIWTSLTPIYVQTVLHVRNPDLQESYFAGGFHVINDYWEIITEDVSSWGMLPGTRILDINLRIFFQAAPIGATSSYEGYVYVDHVVPRH